MEYEVRFYYPKTELDDLMKKLSNVGELTKGLRTYEKTVQFNHSDPNYNFYSEEIDGRFRVRISSNDEKTKCKLSWKRRLKDTTETNINKEEEKEDVFDGPALPCGCGGYGTGTAYALCRESCL